ncbi:MAG: hypothetical protein CVV21_03170 [Candidatus Goldiibacteriota bacterium HGW-Goldbacteria-1]|nr:MAG: hypothetical protein CVV21_03170 [Candidatus Goldiibacteriota bacterium HGW-Goldbacteria-1]
MYLNGSVNRGYNTQRYLQQLQAMYYLLFMAVLHNMKLRLSYAPADVNYTVYEKYDGINESDFNYKHNWAAEGYTSQAKVPGNAGASLGIEPLLSGTVWYKYRLIYNRNSSAGYQVKLFFGPYNNTVADNMVTIDNPFNAPGTWIFRLGNANVDSMKIYSKDLLATAEVPGVSKNGYETTTDYDSIHNITNKSFKNQLYIGGTVYNRNSSYNRDYFYDPARPHAVDHMNNNGSFFRQYEYDANGNVTQHNNYNRQILWDEENRIKQVADTFPGDVHVSENYFYDHKGERKIKVNNYNTGTPQLGDVAMYVNQYAAMWLSNANNINTYTKNYYVGNQRVASRIMSDAACATGTDSFDFTYFYGTDHLGSSTYLTNALGDIVEHNEYTPWGEIWQTEDSMPVVSVGELNNPFKFTGKEMDRTGLYYYGARYYDPQVSLWMSPDPILDKYLPSAGEKDNSKLPGMGGVFNSLNLGLYTYTLNNPMIFIDPDGNVTISITGASSVNVAAGISYNKGFIFGVTDDGKFEWGTTETVAPIGETNAGLFMGLRMEFTTSNTIENTSGTGFDAFGNLAFGIAEAGAEQGIGGIVNDNGDVICGDNGYISYAVQAGFSASVLPVAGGVEKSFTTIDKANEGDGKMLLRYIIGDYNKPNPGVTY